MKIEKKSSIVSENIIIGNFDIFKFCAVIIVISQSRGEFRVIVKQDIQEIFKIISNAVSGKCFQVRDDFFMLENCIIIIF